MARTASMEDSLDDQTLSRIRSRDPLVLSALVESHNPSLIGFLGAHGVPKDHLEELLQATWAAFVEGCERFEGRSRPRTYLIGILLNKIREWKRAAGREQSEESLEDLLDSRFTPEGWWKTPPPAPDRLLESAQTAALLAECLQGLTENQRSAFVLREVEGEDPASICNVLEVSRTHLGVLLFRAKEKLRLCLEGWAP